MSQRLGQHFLKNKEKIRKIAGSLDLEEGDFLVEIGPGHGELTEELKNPGMPGIKLIAIEKDLVLAQVLQEKMKSDGFELVQGDALKILPEIPATYNLKPGSYKMTGNIPYYITGYLLRTIGEMVSKPKLIVFTVQKEVAERVCAEPPKMNLLAASVGFWAEPEIVGYISKKDFSPQPKVDSAIIRLTVKELQTEDNRNYYSFLRMLFKQPRKTILNNLADGLKLKKDYLTERLGKLGINPLDRPQNFSVQDILKLSRELKTEGTRRSDG